MLIFLGVEIMLYKALANRIVRLIFKNNSIDDDQFSNYVFGFEVIISSLFPFLIMLIISLCFGIVRQHLIFTAVFLILRTFCGGHHADTYLKCFVITMLNYFIFLILTLFFDLNLLRYIVFPLIALFLISVFCFAPISTTVNVADRYTYGIVCRILSVTASLLAIITMTTGRSVCSFSVLYGCVSVAVSLLIAKIKIGKEDISHEKDVG